MRVYRICQTNPPTPWDFTSHLARGKRLPRGAPRELVESWDRVSAFSTFDMAANLAAVVHLGRWVAELEIPATVVTVEGKSTFLGRHVDLCGTTAEQLTEYVIAMRGLQG